ncbi:hypothetical protein KSS87_007791 [Heliosperma pusillum]|nr:hypothetical protein KSS87_007791 [Heliosperma pusillum]
MGNKLGRRQVVDDKYTRPQGLYQIKDVDYKKLRKLILESKLAPCYPGGDDCDCGLLEECPICFLHVELWYHFSGVDKRSFRNWQCSKGLEEVILKKRALDEALAKTPRCILVLSDTQPLKMLYEKYMYRCPFCKTSNYAVEYKGVKSKEEKGQEQIEEQKVIEAKIRMRQQELQDEEEKQHKKQVGSPGRVSQTGNTVCSTSGDSFKCSIRSLPLKFPLIYSFWCRDDEFDLDLEDIMVMEAIWLSIQENQRAGYSSTGEGFHGQYTTGDHHVPPVTVPSPSPSPSSPSGGLAGAIAALAERQQLTGESSTTTYNGHVSPSDVLASSSRSSQRMKNSSHSPFENYSSSRAMSNARMFSGDYGVDHSSDVAEAGTHYLNSDDSETEAAILPPPPPPPQYSGRSHSKRFRNTRRKHSSSSSKNLHDTMAEEWDFNVVPPPPPPQILQYNTAGTSGSHFDDEEDDHDYAVHPPPPPPPHYGTDGGFQSSIVPESFEEQMMLAMAVSVAEAQARTTAQGECNSCNSWINEDQLSVISSQLIDVPLGLLGFATRSISSKQSSAAIERSNNGTFFSLMTREPATDIFGAHWLPEWQPVVSSGITTGIVLKLGQDAFANARNDDLKGRKLESIPVKQERLNQLTRGFMKMRDARIVPASVISGMRGGMAMGTFYGLSSWLAEKRGVNDSINYVVASSVSCAAVGVTLQGASEHSINSRFYHVLLRRIEMMRFCKKEITKHYDRK